MTGRIKVKDLNYYIVDSEVKIISKLETDLINQNSIAVWKLINEKENRDSSAIIVKEIDKFDTEEEFKKRYSVTNNIISTKNLSLNTIIEEIKIHFEEIFSNNENYKSNIDNTINNLKSNIKSFNLKNCELKSEYEGIDIDISKKRIKENNIEFPSDILEIEIDKEKFCIKKEDINFKIKYIPDSSIQKLEVSVNDNFFNNEWVEKSISNKIDSLKSNVIERSYDLK